MRTIGKWCGAVAFVLALHFHEWGGAAVCAALVVFLSLEDES